MYKNIDFEFATSNEICLELGNRLRAHRLAQNLQQSDLAEKAGVSRLTIVNLEHKGNVSLLSLLQVIRALGLIDELSTLFELKPKSIARMEAATLSRERASSHGRGLS